MKTLTITVENAIAYHEPDVRPEGRQKLSQPETYPVPVPTESSIPETTTHDFVLFQVKTSEGKILLQLAISNYFQILGTLDGQNVINEWRNIHDRVPHPVDTSSPAIPRPDPQRPPPSKPTAR